MSPEMHVIKSSVWVQTKRRACEEDTYIWKLSVHKVEVPPHWKLRSNHETAWVECVSCITKAFVIGNSWAIVKQPEYRIFPRNLESTKEHFFVGQKWDQPKEWNSFFNSHSDATPVCAESRYWKVYWPHLWCHHEYQTLVQLDEASKHSVVLSTWCHRSHFPSHSSSRSGMSFEKQTRKPLMRDSHVIAQSAHIERKCKCTHESPPTLRQKFRLSQLKQAFL